MQSANCELKPLRIRGIIAQTGGTLVQIIHTRMGVPLPKEDYVSIEPLPGGMFTARGSVTNSCSVAFFNPSPFSSLEEAIASSRRWAEENKVAVIYVKAST